MRGNTARLARGISSPLHPQTKESLRALLWNLQSKGLPAPAPWTEALPRNPAKGAFVLPWNP